MTRLTHWFRDAGATIRLGRPKFLLGGIALFGLGTLCAQRVAGVFDWVIYAWGQLAVTGIQLMTHYSNDYFDFDADRANLNPTRWSGGSQVLVKGELDRRVALDAARVSGLVALSAMAALLASRPGAWLGVALLLSMLVLSWWYSAPPLRLHSRGLGEPTVWLVVPVLTPLTGFILQAKTLALFPVLLVLPLSFLLVAMLLTLQLPDEQGDRRVGKSTWAVSFGPKRVAFVSMGLVLLAFATRFASAAFGLPSSVWLAWVWILPLAAFQLWRLLAGDWKRPAAWSRLEFGSVALFFLALVLDVVAVYRVPESALL